MNMKNKLRISWVVDKRSIVIHSVAVGISLISTTGLKGWLNRLQIAQIILPFLKISISRDEAVIYVGNKGRLTIYFTPPAPKVEGLNPTVKAFGDKLVADLKAAQFTESQIKTILGILSK